jgi:pimeloyl-ACP methyl ester carboxylesterase
MAPPGTGPSAVADVITLPHGWRLSWHEYGDPDGSPIIYTAGTPVSGLAGGSYDQTARAAGLRWISPDKPGYGGSGSQPMVALWTGP